MSQIFATMPLDYNRKPQGTLFLEPLDPLTLAPVGRLTSLGSCKVDIALKTEFVEIRENQSQLRTISHKRAVQSDASLKISVMNFSPLMLAAMHGSQPGVSLTQDAQAAGTITFEDVNDYDVYELVGANGIALFDGVITSVTDGTNKLPAGTYVADALTGLIQITKAPASGTVVVSYSAPAIVDSKHALFNICNQPEFYARGVLRQNNKDGVNLYYTWPKIMVPSAQAMSLIGNDNSYQTVELDCTVLSDSRYPGQEMGWATYITPKGL